MPIVPYIPLPEMTERLMFDTDIQRPRQGEYRTANADMRVQIDYSYTLTDAQWSSFKETLKDNLRADWDVPLWHQRERGRNFAALDATHTVTTEADYRDGSKALFFKGCEEYELAEVDTISGADLTLTSGLVNSYTNAAVMPANPGFIRGPINVQRAQRGLISVSIPFQLRFPGSHKAEPWGSYDGYPIFGCSHGYVSVLDGVLNPNTEYIDSGSGIVTLDDTRNVPDDVQAIEVVGHAWDVRRLWQELDGPASPFWVKTWGGALEVSAALAASSAIDIVETKAAADMIGRHVVIDGIYREVTNATGTGTVTLTLDSALGADVASGAPSSLLSLVRSEADVIDLAHIHGFTSRVAIPVIEETGI